MLFLQKLYVRPYNFLIDLTKRINRKNRDIICIAICCIMFLLYVMVKAANNALKSISIGKLDIVCLFLLLIVVLSVFAAEDRLKFINVNKKAAICYTIYSMAMLVSVILCGFPNDIIMEVITIVFVLPGLYVSLANGNNYSHFIMLLTSTFVNLGMIIHIINLIFAPLVKGQPTAYSGICANPNTLAMLLLPILLSAIYLYTVKKRYRIFYLLMIGYTMGIIVLSEARTTFIAVSIAVLIWAIYILINSDIENKKIYKRAISVILLIAVLIGGIFITDKINKSIEREVVHAQTESSWDQFINKSEIRSGHGLNSFLSGRVELWEYYSKDFTLFGHDYKEAQLQRIEDKIGLGPHNALIDIYYTHGVIAAAAMLALQITAMLYIIRLFMRKKAKGMWGYKSNLFVLLFVPAYCSAGIVEALTSMCDWGIILMFYIALVPVLFNGKYQNEDTMTFK